MFSNGHDSDAAAAEHHRGDENGHVVIENHASLPEF